MSRTYKHVQQGKYHREVNELHDKYQKILKPFSLEWIERSRDYKNLWSNYEFTSFGLHCYRWNSEKNYFKMLKNELREKIANKDLKKQLEDYYENNLSGDTSSRGW